MSEEREAFEAWCAKVDRALDRHPLSNNEKAAAWMAWQAARQSAGATGQEHIGEAVHDEELGKFWEIKQDATNFPIGTKLYAATTRDNGDVKALRDKWKIVDGDCREGANGLTTYHVDAFDEGYRASQSAPIGDNGAKSWREYFGDKHPGDVHQQLLAAYQEIERLKSQPAESKRVELSEGQVIEAIQKACGEYRHGCSYSFEDAWNCIEAALLARAQAKGE